MAQVSWISAEPTPENIADSLLFMSATHEQALALLIYGVQQRRGLVAFTAEPGLGKTRLLNRALDLLKSQACTVLWLQNSATPEEILKATVRSLGVEETGESELELKLAVENALIHVYREGRYYALIIDDADDLKDESLEVVRFLTTLEAKHQQLIQIILCGHPTLTARLSKLNRAQLRKRVYGRIRLRRLSQAETERYIFYKSEIAARPGLITLEAFPLIAQYSRGNPRAVNSLLSKALAMANEQNQSPVDGLTVRAAATQLGLCLPQEGSIDQPRRERTLRDYDNQFLPAETKPWLSPRLAKPVMVASLLVGLSAVVYQQRRSWTMHRAFGYSAAEYISRLSNAAAATQTEQKENERDSRAASPPVPQASNHRFQAANTTAEAGPLTIPMQVERGQTLLGICTKEFGNCDSRLLLWIRALNPHLEDLDHIEPGQTILLPVLGVMQNTDSAE